MNARLKSLFDEQQQLITDLRKAVGLFEAIEIVAEAIWLMSMIEAAIVVAIQDRPPEDVVAHDSVSGWAASERLLVALRSGEKENLELAEHLSAHLPVNSWGAKVARIMILGASLGFELDRTDRPSAMEADASAKQVWSDLNDLARREQRQRLH